MNRSEMNQKLKTTVGRRHIATSSLIEADLASLTPRDPEKISSGNLIGTLEATDGFLVVDTDLIIHHHLSGHALELMNPDSEGHRASSLHDLTGPHLVMMIIRLTAMNHMVVLIGPGLISHGILDLIFRLEGTIMEIIGAAGQTDRGTTDLREISDRASNTGQIIRVVQGHISIPAAATEAECVHGFISSDKFIQTLTKKF